MKPLIQIGKAAAAPTVRELFERLAQREAEEIRRLRQALSAPAHK